MFFFSKSHLASLSLSSPRRTNFLLSLLLVLAGDVSLNPGPDSSPKLLNIGSLNVRSATVINSDIDKPALIQEFIDDHELDFLFINESWLSPDTPQPILNSLTPPGYSFHHVPRPSGRGGGVACISKSDFAASMPSMPTFESFEYMMLKFTRPSKSYQILSLYRPPSSSQSNFFLTSQSFLKALPLRLLILSYLVISTFMST